MWRGRMAVVLAVAVGAVSLGIIQSASAGLSVVSQKVDVDRADQEVLFTVDFNHVPDFTTVDSFGRHLDSFQYEIVPNTTAPFIQLPYLDVTAVIRGDEIGSGSVVPIRNGLKNGSDPNPASGGWGTIRGQVPFTLSGDTMSFAAGFNLLGTTNGTFSYQLFTTNYGSTVSSIESISVPLPAALPADLLTVGGLIGITVIRRKRHVPRTSVGC